MSSDALRPTGVQGVPLKEVLEAIQDVLGEGHEETAKEVMVAALEALIDSMYSIQGSVLSKRRRAYTQMVIAASLRAWKEQEEWELPE